MINIQMLGLKHERLEIIFHDSHTILIVIHNTID